MSVDANVIGQIVASGQPVLCIDTCSLLDVMRDVTRDTVLPANTASAMVLLEAAEDATPRLWVLIAEQVRIELAEREQQVHDDADGRLRAFLASAVRIDQVARSYGATQAISIGHLTGHVAVARAAVERWKRVGRNVATPATAALRAVARGNKGEAPARRGSANTMDCLIVESYLEAMRDLRNAGMTAKAVMLSSNTKDYGGSAKPLPPLGADFAAVQMEFAADARYAQYFLGV